MTQFKILNTDVNPPSFLIDPGPLQPFFQLRFPLRPFLLGRLFLRFITVRSHFINLLLNVPLAGRLRGLPCRCFGALRRQMSTSPLTHDTGRNICDSGGSSSVQPPQNSQECAAYPVREIRHRIC